MVKTPILDLLKKLPPSIIRALQKQLGLTTASFGTTTSITTTTTTPHHETHEDGGRDEIDVTGLSGVLADGQTPAVHASSHMSAGADPIRLDELKAPTDVTTLNATTALHGLLRKLDNDPTHFLDGQGAWDTVKDSDLSTSDLTTNDATTLKHGFLKKLPGGTTTFLRADGNFAAVAPSGGGGAATVVTEFTADGSYPDPGATCLLVEVILVGTGGGGGGGEGEGAGNLRQGGGGGGGGAW